MDDRDLTQPLSPHFLDFLAQWLDGSSFEGQVWVDQTSEGLTSNTELRMRARARLERLVLDDDAQGAIRRVRHWFEQLVNGARGSLEEFQRRRKFLVVVGVPRSGGSYLTAELFSALGHAPTSVPMTVAHDGFPDAEPFRSYAPWNSWTHCLASISEYLAILELYFPSREGTQTYVPKKATKAVYAGGLFNMVFGESAEYFITSRNPLAACKSTADKSGGFPHDRRFVARSAIEKWIQRDLFCLGLAYEQIANLDYVDAYIRYWEQYHIKLALSGLFSHRKYVVIPYGPDGMEKVARGFHDRFSSGILPEKFIRSPLSSELFGEWEGRAIAAIELVGSVWRSVGMTFPTAEVLSC